MIPYLEDFRLVPNENLVAIKWQLEALSLLTVSPCTSLQPVSQNQLLCRFFVKEEADTCANHCKDGLKQSGDLKPKTTSCQAVKRKEEDVNATLALES